VGDELGCWACGGPVEGPLWAPVGALSVHEWGMAPPGKKCVLRDTIMCDAGMCGDGEGCHDDSPTLLYTGVCSVGSVVSSFFFVKAPLSKVRRQKFYVPSPLCQGTFWTA
jgi:hypothetical protein